MTNKNRSECICLLSKWILGLCQRSNKQRCVKKGVIDLRGFRCLFTGNVWRVENWAIYWGKAAQRSGAAKYQQILYYWHLKLRFQAYILKQNIFMTLKFDIIHLWWKIWCLNFSGTHNFLFYTLQCYISPNLPPLSFTKQGSKRSKSLHRLSTPRRENYR